MWSFTTGVGLDITPPTVSDGTIVINNIKTTSLTLNWTKATDDTTSPTYLQYRVYYSTSNDVDTVTNMETYGTAVGVWATDISTMEVPGLVKATNYYFNLMVQDEVGNKSAYSSTLGGTSFDILQINPAIGSNNNDRASTIAVDENYIYVAGFDISLGAFYSQWRIEKRDITTGALVTAFDTDGVVESNRNTFMDELRSIAVDANYIYAVGVDWSPSNFQWRIEKRDIVTGALITSFGTFGVVQSNPSSANEQLYSMAIDINYIYVTGYDCSQFDNDHWRIEKRNITTGGF